MLIMHEPGSGCKGNVYPGTPVFAGANHAVTTLRRRTIVLHGRHTQVKLEQAFWDALAQIAYDRHETLTAVVRLIDHNNKDSALASAIRSYCVTYFLQRRAAPNHRHLAPHLQEAYGHIDELKKLIGRIGGVEAKR